MATHRLSIFHTLRPGSSGNVWVEPASILFTNDIFPSADVLRFKDTGTKDVANGIFAVPQNYVSAPKFYVVWSSTATTGNVVWTVDYATVGGDDTTSLDVSSVEEALTVTDAAPTAAHRRLTSGAMSATAANFTAAETVQVALGRNGASGSDTMAADAYVVDVVFEYQDS